MSEKIDKISYLMDLISKLCSPSYIIETLNNYGFSFKKKFGQHFLINRPLLNRIVDWAGIKTNDIILEIGPGVGALTVYLSALSKEVISVEIDSGFYRYMLNLISKYGLKNVVLLHEDFLDFCKTVNQEKSILARVNKMVSNFPYSIANRAILQTLMSLPNIELIVGMVQKESAERMTANPGAKEYSFLSVIIQTIAEVEVLKKSVSPTNFFPPPGVISSVLRLKRKKGIEQAWLIGFSKFVKISFSQRRKEIIKNILNFFNIDKDRIREAVVNLCGKYSTRAEELDPETFLKLYNKLKDNLQKKTTKMRLI